MEQREAMEPIIVLLVIAIIVRILLDLSSMTRPSYVFDACYAVLFLAVGLAEFVTGGQALVGYVSIVLGIVWSLLGFYRYKKRTRPHNNDRTIPGN
jgi:steroid 5-alpha reductase family enzyme